MATPIILVCPLCGATVHEGGEPAPGACGTCGAVYGGGGDHPVTACEAVIAQWGAQGRLDARTLATGLFVLDADEPLSRRVAVTSDRRQGFYRWWVFAAPGEDRAAVLAEAAARG